MAPNLLGKVATSMFLDEEPTTSPSIAEPVQIITPKPAPIISRRTTILEVVSTPLQVKPKYHWQIVWHNVFAFLYLHLAGLYGVYLMFTVAQLQTVIYTHVLLFLIGQGVTAGAHRLWTHRCYRARLPLQILLMILQTASLQNHIYEWARDHRVHHKFTDTDADPHNAKRGFFFSHIGWLMLKKHPDVTTKGRTVDMSDLENDPLVQWQRRYYALLAPLLAFIVPASIPILWGESAWVAWHLCAVARYTVSLNGTWLVNSAAHIWGNRPYERDILPRENRAVAFLAFGEGWHNYHHVFPWDYKASELGAYSLNWSTGFIDLMAKFGWAYDLKTAGPDLVNKRARRTGDGTRPLWGWGDKDMDVMERRSAAEYNKAEEDET